MKIVEERPSFLQRAKTIPTNVRGIDFDFTLQRQQFLSNFKRIAPSTNNKILMRVFLRCLRHKERTNSSSKSHIMLLSRTKVKDSVRKAPIAKRAKMKANQISLFQWCNDVWEITNQIIFHTFLKKSRGLWTRLSTVNHRRSFPIFFWGEGRLYTGYILRWRTGRFLPILYPCLTGNWYPGLPRSVLYGYCKRCAKRIFLWWRN